jgi:hypothetical protein
MRDLKDVIKSSVEFKRKSWERDDDDETCDTGNATEPERDDKREQAE